MRRAGLVALTALIATVGEAAAQPAVPPGPDSAPAALRPGHVVIGIGGAWIGVDAVGGVRAETRASAVGTTSPPGFGLFDTDSRVGAAPAGEATVTMAVTPSWAVEVRGAMGRPTLTTTITDDVEATGAFTATSEIAEYAVDASVLYQPAWAAVGRNVRGYLLAGGGYLRQLYDRDALVETGSTMHVGAGARWWITGGHGSGVAVGLTGDIRWMFRRDGITFEDGTRSLPAIAVRAFVGF
jgi:hypothetical protein